MRLMLAQSELEELGKCDWLTTVLRNSTHAGGSRAMAYLIV
jgi:hypothetical protein